MAAIVEARNLRRLGDVDAALGALTRAAQTTGASVLLQADLASGRWQLSRVVLDTHIEDVTRWLGRAPDPDTGRPNRALSAAVERLSGHELLTLEGQDLTLLSALRATAERQHLRLSLRAPSDLGDRKYVCAAEVIY